jgi:hypothetical protein
VIVLLVIVLILPATMNTYALPWYHNFSNTDMFDSVMRIGRLLLPDTHTRLHPHTRHAYISVLIHMTHMGLSPGDLRDFLLTYIDEAYDVDNPEPEYLDSRLVRAALLGHTRVIREHAHKLPGSEMIWVCVAALVTGHARTVSVVADMLPSMVGTGDLWDRLRTSLRRIASMYLGDADRWLGGLKTTAYYDRVCAEARAEA